MLAAVRIGIVDFNFPPRKWKSCVEVIPTERPSRNVRKVPRLKASVGHEMHLGTLSAETVSDTVVVSASVIVAVCGPVCRAALVASVVVTVRLSVP